VRVRITGPRKIGPRERIPVTIINVKPYHIVMLNNTILCDKSTELPFAFDTFDLAELCIQEHRMKDCVVEKVELEQLAHMCRDRAVPFDRVMLITDPSQLYVLR
jgi:hypothetical protein